MPGSPPTPSAPAPEPPPSPNYLQRDDDGAEAARKRLQAKQYRFFSLHNLRKKSSSNLSKRPGKGGKRKGSQWSTVSAREEEAPPADTGRDEAEGGGGVPTLPRSFSAFSAQSGKVPLIDLDDSIIADEHQWKDEYRWAVLYENQRGMTLFSTPYYSRAGLIPGIDPPAFTLPSPLVKRGAHQPTVSLEQYPLPDGTWRWVSSAWLIDMRTDGRVQHDGFEYNWWFRRKGWRANVGRLSKGGFVRRRRWVRLMTRPREGRQGDDGEGEVERDTLKSGASVVTAGAQMQPSLEDLECDAWHGNDAQEDWARLALLMRRAERDGRKLELWRKWLAPHLADKLDEKGKARVRLWTEDDEYVGGEDRDAEKRQSVASRGGEPVALERIANILHIHGQDILRTFTYPESRARFLELLGYAGLLPDVNAGLGLGFSGSMVEFWSYENAVRPASLDSKDEKVAAVGGPEDVAAEVEEEKGKEERIAQNMDDPGKKVEGYSA